MRTKQYCYYRIKSLLHSLLSYFLICLQVFNYALIFFCLLRNIYLGYLMVFSKSTGFSEKVKLGEIGKLLKACHQSSKHVVGPCVSLACFYLLFVKFGYLKLCFLKALIVYSLCYFFYRKAPTNMKQMSQCNIKLRLV